MMGECTTILGLFLGLCLASFVLKVLGSLFLKPRLLERALRKQGIPGPPYSFFNGDHKKMRKMMQQAIASMPKTPTHDILPYYNPLMYQMTTKYGKMFYIWLGTLPRVVVLEPKLIREMLTDKVGEFQKPGINAFTKLFTAGVSSLNGEKWAMHRKIINPAFHMEKLKGMTAPIAQCIEAMISEWEEALGLKESHEFDVSTEFQKLTADIISRVAFGNSYEEGSRVFQLLNEQGKLLSKVYYMASFPWLRHLPTKTNIRMKRINKEVTNTLRGIVKARQKAMEVGSSYVVKDDLLGLLLESNLKEQRENNSSQSKGGMTLEEVIEECKLFYFAGHETTANLLTWTIVALSMHQDWQEKVREEVLRIVGREKTPNFDDLSHLKNVTMVLQETLRLYPPVSITRTTTRKGAKLGGKYLPGGVSMFVPTPFLHRDQQVWGKDVLEFNPRRFSEGISKASDRDPAPYFPFGWGPRICIGQNLSMLEARMALTIMLQRFSFELSPSYAHIPYFVLTLQPLRGAQIIVHRLHPSS